MAATVTNQRVARPFHQDKHTRQVAGCESRSVNGDASSSLTGPPVACVPVSLFTGPYVVRQSTIKKTRR